MYFYVDIKYALERSSSHCASGKVKVKSGMMDQKLPFGLMNLVSFPTFTMTNNKVHWQNTSFGPMKFPWVTFSKEFLIFLEFKHKVEIPCGRKTGKSPSVLSFHTLWMVISWLKEVTIGNTVDGRNPANHLGGITCWLEEIRLTSWGWYFIPLFTGF